MAKLEIQIATFFNSRIKGTEERDILQGNEVSGNKGSDYLSGTEIDDYLAGNEGNDSLQGNLGDDTLIGGRGDDLLLGIWGNNQLLGNEGEDTLIAGGGNDILVGGSGNDTLTSGFSFESMAAVDLLQGGEGADTFDLSSFFENYLGDFGSNRPNQTFVRDFNPQEGDRIKLYQSNVEYSLTSKQDGVTLLAHHSQNTFELASFENISIEEITSSLI